MMSIGVIIVFLGWFFQDDEDPEPGLADMGGLVGIALIVFSIAVKLWEVMP